MWLALFYAWALGAALMMVFILSVKKRGHLNVEGEEWAVQVAAVVAVVAWPILVFGALVLGSNRDEDE